MAKAEYRSAIRSRKLINDALADLLQEKSLDKITVTDVVRRADINRGTFYAHYADIPDVLNHLIEKTMNQLRDAVSRQAPETPHMSQVILRQIQSILEDDLAFYQKIMSSSAYPMLAEQLVDVVLEYLMQNEQAFEAGSHEDFLLSIRFCAGGLSRLYRDWFAGKIPLTLDELTEKSIQKLSGIIPEEQIL